jgi:hypothetical protein
MKMTPATFSKATYHTLQTVAINFFPFPSILSKRIEAHLLSSHPKTN